MRKDHKARMIEAMAAQLRAQGFHSTGLAQVLQVSGAPRGSLYFHFPGGKEELACAALDQTAHEWRQHIEAAFAGAASAAEAVRALCRAVADRLVASEFRDGSPLATVALEAASSSERVREACTQHYASWQELIEHRLCALGHEPARAHDQALLLVSALEGALVLARVYRSTVPLDRVAASLDAMMAVTS